MNIFKDHRFNAVALGHFFVDTLNGQRSILFAYLSGMLGLSNSMLGLISTLYVASASTIQPIFGYLTDRAGTRIMVSGGVIWMVVFYSLAVTTSGYSSIILLIIASIGSGVFHPAGTNQATLEGSQHLSGRETTALAIFVFFGGVGGFFGPIISGTFINNWGLKSLIIVAMVGIPITAYSLKMLPKREEYEAVESRRVSVNTEFGTYKKALKDGLIILGIVAAFQAWTSHSMVTFLPKYLSDLGMGPSEYGIISSVFVIGITFGNFLGGSLADQWGKKIVIMLSMILASPPILLIALFGFSGWHYLVIPVAGFFIGAGYTGVVVLAQKLVPAGKGFATGIILGFIFTCGALGTLLSGAVADQFGFKYVFILAATLIFLGGIVTPFVPSKQK